MFKIVENEDGSTGVYSIDTGKLICNVRGKTNTAGGNGHAVLKERNASAPAGKKTLTEVQLGSSSSEYNLRHLSIREENSNDQSPVLSPLPLALREDESDDPCDDCITQDDFLRCANLISRKKLEQSSTSDLKQSFPLRRISRTTVHKFSSSGTEVLENVGISSPMGGRVLQSLQCIVVDKQKRQNNVKNYDRFCHAVRSNYDMDGCNTPQLRCRDLLRKYPITFKPQKSWYEYDHVYTFNRKQRAEKYKIACSGLNKRARRLKRLCKKLTVSVKRLSPQDISEIKRELKRRSVVLGNGNGKFCGSSTENPYLNPSLKTGISKGTIIASVKRYWSSQNVRKPIPGMLVASPKTVCVKKIKLSNNVHLPYLQYSLPKSLQITPIRTPTKQYLPLSSKNNGAFLKLPSGTTCKRFQCLNTENDGKEVPLSDISCLDSKRKALSLKKGVGESVACVPLQDVIQKFLKVGDKCYIKGTCIKACGIEEQRENISCVNNIDSIGNPNLSHDHAYHRSPAINTVKPINREPEFGKVEASVKATYGSQTSVLSENCLPCKLPNVNVLLPHKATHTMVIDGSLKSPEQRLNQPLSSHVLYNNTGNILKSVKPKKNQVSKSIPLIDISDDSSDESNSSRILPSVNCILNSNGSGNSNLPRIASVKWIFNCYGCGFESTVHSQDEINIMVLRHMRVYHSVNDPASFLSSYFKSSERAVVTEAFPGYKINKT